MKTRTQWQLEMLEIKRWQLTRFGNTGVRQSVEFAMERIARGIFNPPKTLAARLDHAELLAMARASGVEACPIVAVHAES